MQRRQFLQTALASLGSYCLSVQANTAQPTYFYSASNTSDDNYFFSLWDFASQQIYCYPIPFRGHGILPLGNKRVLMCGRRPAFESTVVNISNHDIQVFKATEGKHFNGHACLSPDGSVFFSSENDYVNKQGVLGIRDSKTLQVLGEYSTYGLDPHDVRLMPDGKHLVIANGGIQTHPDYDRRKLNLDTMQPSLVYIDVQNGRKVEEYRLNDHLLSIRHLLITPEGDVGAALQYEGDLYRRQPESLVAWQTKGADLNLLTIAPPNIGMFQGYMADLALAPETTILAVTSPRGKQVSFWDLTTKRFLYAYALPEPSGIAFLPHLQQFLVSDMSGGLNLLYADKQGAIAHGLYQSTQIGWDNHLLVV